MAEKLTPRTGETTSTPATRPHHPLMSLRDEVDRLFDTFFPSTFGRAIFDVDPWRDRALGALGNRAFGAMGDIAPRMDVRESADHYDVSVELPGMDEKDVAVKVQGDTLIISGEKKSEHTDESGAVHLTERSYGAFVRSVRLPDDANAEGIKADYAKGVLTIGVPKRPEGKAEKKIDVVTH